MGSNNYMNGHFDIGGITPSRYFFAIAAILGVLFATTSGESERGFSVVLLQWQLQTLVPMALLIGSHLLLLRWINPARINPWAGLALSGLIGATLFTPFALAIESWLDPTIAIEDPLNELIDEWGGVAPPVIVAWMALNAPWLLGYRLEKSAAPGAGPAASETLPEFIELLPQEKRGKPLMLKSELHYLNVVTDCGSGLILYNLGDAIDALPANTGLQVHRSYWVALAAIESLNRQGRQGELRLVNGDVVPVSRQRLGAVTEALKQTGA